MTAAELLMQDPSLITEILCAGPNEEKPAVIMAINAGLDAFVLFALAHGMPVTAPAFGKPGGLLEEAVFRNSPDLVSCALLYQADPNQINTRLNCSLLQEIVNVACDVHSGEWTQSKALKIARMLLDAGADPLLPAGINTAISSLCILKWSRCPDIGAIFIEALKRSGDVRDLQIDGMPIVEAAARYDNILALKHLVNAGAYADTKSLFPILRGKGLSLHIPVIKDLIQLRQATQSRISIEPEPSSQRMQINLVPKNFLTLQQGPRLTGNDRATRCRLLDMAIIQGRFVTVTKILAEDPSLITERISVKGRPDISAIHRAADLGMTALIPFALAQGILPDDPSFGFRGLLKMGVSQSSPAITSYALLNGADPNLNGADPNQYPIDSDNPKTFLDLVIDDENQGWEGNTKEGRGVRVLKMATMLLDAGANPIHPGAANTGLHRLCRDIWQTDPELKTLFADILSRGGSPCANMLSDGTPILLIAASAKNIPAMKLLIEAGANTDCDVLGRDLFKFLKDKGLGAHIPTLTELIMLRQIAHASAATLSPTVTIVDGQGEHDTAKLRSRDVF